MMLRNTLRSHARYLFAGLLFSTAIGFAQTGGWRRADEPGPNASADPSTPVERLDQEGAPPAGPAQAGGVSARLTIPAGKFITVRVNQPLSSDHSQVGDFFTATLAEPVVVDGVVVAQTGQTLSGRVSEVDRGGRVKGVSRLGVQLTELTAVDGQQLPIQTQFIGRRGPSTEGRDAAIIGGTTAAGAAIGAASTWDAGRGAAIGAGAGAALGIAGVLLSRGAPAVIYPETLLSFRIEAPVNVSTERAPQAFRYVDPNEYREQPPLQTRVAPPPPGAAPYPYYAPAYPYPYAYAYPYPYWGPRFGVVIGPRYYRGYRRGWWR
ncbi:MAG: hypothetical protein C5B51_09990 [Terriglobia bacterium]|nr:MAG: hypothetical protein C5B51_09990 [Terriglobia bacterium]